MCGRSRCALAPERVEQVTGVSRDRWVDADRYRPSYNVQPGHWTPILRLDEQHTPMLQTMKWGLVPSFTKPGETPDHFKMFNARSETVTEKPIFSRLLPQQRCVVLLEGFYEWKADAGGKKQPYYITFGEGSVMRMAGLFDVWKGGPEGPMATYSILTVDAAPKLTWLHNRMPVLLPDNDAVAEWLGTGSTASSKGSSQQQQQHQAEQEKEHQEQGDEEAGSSNREKASAFKLTQQLCVPCNSDALKWHPVTPAMSKASYNCPDASKDVRTKKGSISTFFKASNKAIAPPPADDVGDSKPPPAAAGSSKTSAAAAGSSKGSDAAAKPAAGSGAAAAVPELVAPAAAEGKASGQQHQQQQQTSSPASAKQGTINSFFKPVSSPAVRNPDEQSGPSAADNTAAAAVKEKGGSSGKRAAEAASAGNAKKGKLA